MCKFIEVERVVHRLNDKGTGLHVRLITDETVMYKDMTFEEMIKLRDFLDKQIDTIGKSFFERAGSL